MSWQPIETAPRDGAWVLITGCGGTSCVLVAAWIEESPDENFHEPGWLGFWMGYEQWVSAPTHWMPLPSPPDQSPSPYPTNKPPG